MIVLLPIEMKFSQVVWIVQVQLQLEQIVEQEATTAKIWVPS